MLSSSHAADDAEVAALELRLDEAVEVLEDMMMANAYSDGQRKSSSPFLGPWAVTDDSHEMSDSGGEEGLESLAPKKARMSRVVSDPVVSSGDERGHKRRSVRKRGGSSKRHKTQPAKAQETMVVSVSESSLSDAAGRFRVTKKRSKKAGSAGPDAKATKAASASTDKAETEAVRRPYAADEPKAEAKATHRTAEKNPAPNDDFVVGVQCLPERAEYRCSLCSEDYTMETDHNPWWALVRHECPRCRKTQFPTINIAAPSNHISFLALPVTAPVAATAPVPPADEETPGANASTDDDDDVESTVESDDDLFFQNAKQVAGDSVDFMLEALANTFPEQASLNDGCGDEPCGGAARGGGDDESTWRPEARACRVCPVATEQQPELDCDELGPLEANSLFGLFEHARYCVGKHHSKRHAHLCACTKYVMLHLRDCAGTLPDGRRCPFSWCGPCRRALAKHLD